MGIEVFICLELIKRRYFAIKVFIRYLGIDQSCQHYQINLDFENFLMMLLDLIIPLAVFISGINAECPNIDELPVLNDAGDQFYCAFRWSDDCPWDNDIPLEACNGDHSTYMDGYDWENGGVSGFISFGGTIVKAGCTLYAYSGTHFDGDHHDYNGAATFPTGCPYSDRDYCHDVMWDNGKRWGWPSFKCRCQQDPIICAPTDHWVKIMQCDNTNNDLEAKCPYVETIGTTWSASASESMSIDATIEAAMSESFFGMFSSVIGLSSTTGYDWNNTSSAARSETKTFDEEAVVDAHSLLIIEGAEGECGGNNVKTELFRFTTINANGKVTNQTLKPDKPRQ